MTFLIAVYGDSYMSYLGALIESIVETYSENVRIIVSYANMAPSLIESAKQKAPFVRFHSSNKYSFSDENNINKKISLKAKMWDELIVLSQSKRNVLLDTDMIVLKQIDRFFEQEFDIAYTYKTDEDENLSWPLNSGVMLARKSPASLSFFKEWNRKNNYILNNDVRLERACTAWGGADQAALGEMLKSRDQSEFCKMIMRNGIKFQGVPCKYLNETRCVPMTADTHIIHYKMRWRPVLPKGNFTEYRPKGKCLEMFRIWRGFYERWTKR